ncbi:MAG TPA: transaldolase family protein [Terriglobales bacterium]|jgi:transaldolase|nr:transaldolase family protein [Terriglobales bacterium]
MRIFIDSANVKEIERWLRQGIVDGVTTNPSIMLKDGVSDLENGARGLCKLLGERPVSIEVTSNEPQEMLAQARTLASFAENIVVKIPVITEDGRSCLEVVNTLVREDIAVNCTAILSFNQAVLAAKAGATYISIFAGRIGDEGGDSSAVVAGVRRWLDMWAYPSRIIVGSIRSAIEVQQAALAGAHIVTVPPPFLGKMIDHHYTRETVRQFNQDAAKALTQIRQKQIA